MESKHEGMSSSVAGVRLPVGVTIRPYRPLDHNACRRLWGELVEHTGELYGRVAPRRSSGKGNDNEADQDPGAGFEEYLTRLDLSGMWVADGVEDGVVGFVGLIASPSYAR